MRSLTWFKGQCAQVKAFLRPTQPAAAVAQTPTLAAADAAEAPHDGADQDSQVTLYHYNEANGSGDVNAPGSSSENQTEPIHEEGGEEPEQERRHSDLGPAILLTPPTPSEELGHMDLDSDNDEDQLPSVETTEPSSATEIQQGESSSATQLDKPAESATSSTAQNETENSSAATSVIASKDDWVKPLQTETTARLQKELWKAREQRDDFHRQLAAANLEINKRRSDILLFERNRKQDIEHALQEQKEDLFAHMTELKSRNTELEANMATLIEQLKTLQRKMAEVQAQCGVLGLEISRLTATLVDRDKNIKSLEAELRESKAAGEALAEKCQQTLDIKKGIEQAAEAIEQRLHAQSVALTGELNEKRAEIAALQSDLEAHRIALADRNGTVAYLSASLAEVEAETAVSQLRERIKSLVDRVENWRQDEYKCVSECQQIAAALSALIDERENKPVIPGPLRCETMFTVRHAANAHAVQPPSARSPLLDVLEEAVHEYQDSPGSSEHDNRSETEMSGPKAAQSPVPPPPRNQQVNLRERGPRDRVPSSQTFGKE
ncbi:hypothetical protein HDU87_004848 [Geranomyces variabilis]|uniref:Uncharacterized protein n=1 Tax=Geranomyces variabilis TaxID=109894 RepID=A0AAD5TI57_9FUNG|nr:hypothetical protein HDU87_004848 [Geranomyces variabilis]